MGIGAESDVEVEAGGGDVEAGVYVDADAEREAGGGAHVDVVTAVHAPHATFVVAAWASLRAQTFPGWSWWVQIDGADADPVLAALRDCGASGDDRVHVDRNGTEAGPAVTRNIALGRSRAPLVQNLDADDELEPQALATLVDALAAHPSAGFAFGHARDLLPDGSLRAHPLALRPGLVPRGDLVTRWSTAGDDYRLPAHPAGVMWRRSLLLTAGGWPALHTMEDTGLLMAASALAPAVFVDAPILRYRKHPHQLSQARPAFRGGEGQISLVLQRISVLAREPTDGDR